MKNAAGFESALNPWLIGLRLVVVLVLAGSLLVSTSLLATPVAYELALPVLAALVISIVVHRLTRTSPLWAHPHALFANVVFDLVCIAALLAASGGAANPFSVILLVYVALAASTLPPKPTFVLSALSACTFGALFLMPKDPACHVDNSVAAFNNHLYGMWIAFVLGAGLVAYFLTGVRRAIRARDEELARLRLRDVQATKFEALGTLAAGTAHELGTPLGTMCVLAREIESGKLPEAEARERARTIVEQVERCQKVLARMRLGPRDLAVESDADLETAVPAAVSAWCAAHPDAVVQIRKLENGPVALAKSDVEAALGVLLDNAHAAMQAGHSGPIVVEAGVGPGGAYVTVEDEGSGIAEPIAARVGEPFFTTKPHGEGMGLGLYVVRRLLEPIGGELSIEPRAPHGTRVRLRFGAPTPVPA